MESLKECNFQHRPQENSTIVNYKDEIVRTIQTSSVTVIEGDTGCGKSTQVPQFILDSCNQQNKYCNIVVCQPRRIAAHSIAKRVADEREWSLGSVVGCQVGMYKNVSKDTRLTYCTTGVLLRKFISAKNMLEFTHVVLDEVHERDQEMDFLILFIKILLRSNSRTVKVVLMSATFNAKKFAEYFAFPTETGFIKAPIVTIATERKFKNHTHYLCELEGLGNLPEVMFRKPRLSSQMIQFGIKLIYIFDDMDERSDYNAEDLKKFGGEKPRHAVLVFLPGIREIEEMHGIMSSQCQKSKWDIVVLHSSITNEEQSKVFTSPPKGYRRIVLSTNIAESSITINDVAYVVDFCLTKQLVTDPTTNLQCLELVWASRDRCEQRAGRVGRVMDGRVYRLVPKKLYNQDFRQENQPEITRSPLETLVLQSKLLDMDEPKAVLALAMDPPDISNLERAILLLKEAGGLVNVADRDNPCDGKLTDLGRIMAALPVDIHLAKLMALGHAFKVLRETIIMAASMALKSMFSNPFQIRMEAYKAKIHWADGSSSDCMAFLNAYTVWQRMIMSNHIKRNTREELDWAKRKFIQVEVMHEVYYLVNELTQRLERLGIKETSGPNMLVMDEVDRNLILKIVIAGAFYPNYFIRQQNDNSCGVRGLGGLDPTRTVYLQGWKLEQPGQLYVKRIQELFKAVVPNYQQALVEFDGSTKVYVMFSDEKHYVNERNWNEIPGKISPSVYKVLQMGKLGMNINVPVLDDVESARMMADQLELPTTTHSICFNQDAFDEMQRKLPKVLPNLPCLSTNKIPIEIVHFEHVSKFYVHIRDEDNDKNKSKIEKLLNDPEESSNILKPINRKLKFGDLVAAEWNDTRQIFRATVESVYEVNNEEVANLFYIDFGCRSFKRCADLKFISEDSELMDIRALALECTLTGLEPSKRKDSTGKWCPEAEGLFESYILKHYLLYGEVYSYL